MARGRWKVSEEQVAIEAFVVLIQKQKCTRIYTKADLTSALKRPAIYTDFLKICLEFDDSKDLSLLRKGLLFVTKGIGATKLAMRAGLTRVTLYRMLSKGGNPTLRNLIQLFRALNLRPWLVDEAFIKSRQKVTRPKDLKSTWAAPRYPFRGKPPKGLSDDKEDEEIEEWEKI